MKFNLDDILKDKKAVTNYVYKVLAIEGTYYYCERGFLERDVFVGEGCYTKIFFKNEDSFCNVKNYLDSDEVNEYPEKPDPDVNDSRQATDDIWNSDNNEITMYAALTYAKIHDIIALDSQGKSHQDISISTNCTIDNVDAVLLTYHYLNGVIVDIEAELREENKSLQQELDAVYKAVARRFLSSKELNL